MKERYIGDEMVYRQQHHHSSGGSQRGQVGKSIPHREIWWSHVCRLRRRKPERYVLMDSQANNFFKVGMNLKIMQEIDLSRRLNAEIAKRKKKFLGFERRHRKFRRQHQLERVSVSTVSNLHTVTSILKLSVTSARFESGKYR